MPTEALWHAFCEARSNYHEEFLSRPGRSWPGSRVAETRGVARKQGEMRMATWQLVIVGAASVVIVAMLIVKVLKGKQQA